MKLISPILLCSFLLAISWSALQAQKFSVDYEVDLATSNEMFKTLGVQSLKINIPKEFLNRKFRILV